MKKPSGTAKSKQSSARSWSKQYFNDGDLGMELGDDKLPHYGPEKLSRRTIIANFLKVSTLGSTISWQLIPGLTKIAVP